MDAVEKMLNTIKADPELYLGKVSLERLSAFINGYLLGKYEEGEEFPAVYPGFQEFVQDKFEIYSAHDWASIIGFFSSSQQEAFYNFFTLLDEFKQQN